MGCRAARWLVRKLRCFLLNNIDTKRFVRSSMRYRLQQIRFQDPWSHLSEIQNSIFRKSDLNSIAGCSNVYLHISTEYTTLIPEGLILGYYLQLIFTRWYMIFDCIPMPDTVAFLISSHLKGHDERSRIMRRTIVRYMTLSFLLVLQKLCPSIKRRFPTTTHLTKAGQSLFWFSTIRIFINYFVYTVLQDAPNTTWIIRHGLV